VGVKAEMVNSSVRPTADFVVRIDSISCRGEVEGDSGTATGSVGDVVCGCRFGHVGGITGREGTDSSE